MIRSLIKFRRYAGRYKRSLTAGVLLSILQIGFNLAQPWPLAFLVDNVLSSENPRYSSNVGISVAVVSLLTIVLASAIADYWSTWYMAGTGERIAVDLRQGVFAHLQRLSLRYHGQHSVGELSSRVMGDVDRVQELLIQLLAVLIPNSLLMMGMLAVMIGVDPIFTVFALASTPLMVLLTWRSTRELKRASRVARRYDGEVAAAATESLSATPVVQALSLEVPFQARFGDLSRASLRAGLTAVRQKARFSPIVDVSGAISLAVVMGVGAQRVLDGRMSLGVMLVFTTYVGSLYKPIKALTKLGTVISKGTVSAERIDSVLSTVPEISDRAHALIAPQFRGEIVFDHVSFSYGKQPVLSDIDFSIAPGEMVAFVGPTGAGKSTLVSLVPRLYDPSSGVVRVDGYDLRDLSLTSLRSQIAMVLQDTILFRGSLAENIAFGSKDARPESIRRAAELALVDEFADRLPDGLDTLVGERGASLSGGQRQRVAIARALLRNAPILILDEPTSALDAESEALVVRALKTLTEGRTTLIIAHRLSTIKGADRIIMVEDGRISGSGPHEELRRSSSTYARMVELQGMSSLGRLTADDEAGDHGRGLAADS